MLKFLQSHMLMKLAPSQSSCHVDSDSMCSLKNGLRMKELHKDKVQVTLGKKQSEMVEVIGQCSWFLWANFSFQGFVVKVPEPTVGLQVSPYHWLNFIGL